MIINFPLIRLGQVASVKSGFAFRGSDMGGVGVPVIKIKNIHPPNVDIKNVERVPYKVIDGNKRAEKFLLGEGDALVAMTGATVGKLGRFPKTTEQFYLNQRVGKLFLNEPDRANYDFLYYVLSQRKYVDQIFSSADGSAQANVSGDQIEAFIIPLPPIEMQAAISDILLTLDDKIENNRRMNETLEAMARAIFKSWFVDFDPVRAKMEGRPIRFPDDISDLFPNELVDSEIGQIPKGWKNITVGDLIVPKRGKTITKNKTIEGVIPVVAGGLEPAYFHNQSNVDAPVITISASGANAGFTRLYNENIWASDCSYISRKQTDTPYFWYVFLKTHQKQIYHMQQGAAQPHIYPSDLMRLELCVPLDEKLIQYFERLALPYFQRISIAQQESKTLAELRDTLLPKLISGEIRVADAERKMETAI